MPIFKVKVKWGKELYPGIEVNTDEKPLVFKAQIYALTGVLPERQKIMCQGAVLKDSDWNGFQIQNGRTILLMGSKEEDLLVEPVEKPQFIEDLNESEVSYAFNLPGGIENLGNTCYINATFQCLSVVPEICQALASVRTSDISNDNNPLASSLVNSLQNIFKKLKAGEVTRPVLLVEMLHITLPQFAEKNTQGVYKQQDANEFFTELLRILQMSLKSVKSETAQITQYGSIIDQFLSGKYLIELKCNENDEEAVSVSKEDFIQLSCFISQDVKYLFSGLKLKMQEKITKFSSVLQRNAVYTKTCKIDRLPAYLTIQFVRFCYKERESVSAKILKKIKFPINFDAFELCTERLQEKLMPMRLKFKEYEDSKLTKSQMEISSHNSLSNVRTGDNKEVNYAPTSFENDLGSNNSGYYTLNSIITHKGRSASSGHYVAWIRQTNNIWLMCDDDLITPVTEEDILKLSGGGDWHCAYVLLYGPRKLEID